MKTTLHKLTLLLIFSVLSGTYKLHAQNIVFDAVINAPAYGGHMIVGNSGNYYVATSDKISCISPTGIAFWSVELQYPGLSVCRIFETGNELVLAGTIYTSPNAVCYLLKLDASHNVSWMHEYADSTATSIWMSAACRMSDGAFLIGAGNYIYKTDSIGNVIWGRVLNLSVSQILESPDHNYIIGASLSTVIKMDTAGTLQWRHSYYLQVPNADGNVTGIAEAPGGFLFTGTCGEYGSGNFMIVRTDSNGNMLDASAFTDTVGAWVVESPAGFAIGDSGMIISLRRYQQITGSFIRGGMGFVDTAGALKWTREFTSIWDVMSVQLDTGYVVLGISSMVNTRYGLTRTDYHGVSDCNSTGITLVRGPGVVDTLLNISINIASISSTQGVVMQPLVNPISIIILCVPVGQDEHTMDATGIYPNPSTGVFHFHIPGGAKFATQIEIYDALGRTVLKTYGQRQDFEIDLTQFSNGIYFYQVMSEDKLTGQGKLLVQ